MANGMISARLDPASDALVIALSGPVSGEAYVDFMLDLVRTRPETMARDRIYDLRAYEGSIAHQDLRRLGEAADALMPDRVSNLVLVTRDRGFVFWTKAIERDLALPRRYAIVATMEEAPPALARLRAAAG